jgi:hypothetical protein
MMVFYKILKLDPTYLYFLFATNFDANIIEDLIDKIITFCH